MQDMDVWFGKREDLEWDTFRDWFKLRHPKVDAEATSTYDRIFHRLNVEEWDDISKEDIVSSFVKRDFAVRIIDKAALAAEGEDIDMGELEQLLTDYYNETGAVNDLDSYEVTDDLEELIEKSEVGGYNWKLPFLNKSIGTCRKGKLYIVAARPNSGKTTFMAQEYVEIAKQVPDDHVVLWFNNEEDGIDVKWRHWEALLERSKDSIEADPRKAKVEIEKLIGDMKKIRLIDKPGFSINDVYSYIKKYEGKVGAIIFDQLWKVRGFEKSSTTDVDRQQKMFGWARELAKQYCPVITSHQLKGDAEGQAYPDMSMLYGSTTAIQGEADVILMIGNKNELGFEDLRHISVAKVKGAYGPYVDPAYRNGKQDVILEPTRARFVEP
jgi:replicative DNA helicase